MSQAPARGIGRLFLRKSVAQMQAEHAQGELKRTLGALNLILLGIGCIIGTGIFVLVGVAAANFSGPAITISFIITGVLCACVALCYAELASMLPVSGSAYSYSYASMGEFVAWVMGLLLVLEYGLAASTVAVGWSGYVVSLLHDIGVNVPAALTAAPGVEIKDAAGTVIGHGSVNVPAVIAIIAVTTLLVVGVQESATANNIVVAIKLTVVVAFVCVGAFYVDTALWHPLVPAEIPPPPADTPRGFWADTWRALVNIATGDNSSRYGINGVIAGAATIFFAYLGFEAVSTAGAEAKNPARDMPIGIIGSLLICTALYIVTSAVLVGIVPYTELNHPAPVALAVDRMGLPGFAKVVKLGAIAGISSVMLVLLYGQTRIFYTMARDGLLPSVFARVHPRYRTPWIGTIIVGVVVSGLAGFMSLTNLASLANVGSLTAFAMVCLTVVYLRITAPGLVRPFRTPMYLPVALVGAGMCAILVKALMANEHTSTFFLRYLGGGILVYFLFGLWNSKLGKGETVVFAEPTPDLPKKLDV